RQRARAAYIAFFIIAATATEIFVPMFAGRLIDALAANLRNEALTLFAAMAALGLAMVVLRHVAWAGIIPFTLRMMRDVTQDGFHRVQRFSTDWHANSFAGSTVRKITRGMWAFDTLNDVLLLQLLPSLAVLVGTMLLLGWHWPVLGVVMAVGAVAYVVMTLVLATR
ncbi:ABC transporter ATP-binding protein, partial [Escherichia coli]|nr:ABC transporter ATP-binding protein [Escherichia coli]